MARSDARVSQPPDPRIRRFGSTSDAERTWEGYRAAPTGSRSSPVTRKPSRSPRSNRRLTSSMVATSSRLKYRSPQFAHTPATRWSATTYEPRRTSSSTDRSPTSVAPRRNHLLSVAGIARSPCAKMLTNRADVVESGDGDVGVQDVLHRSATARWPPCARAFARIARISWVVSPAQGPIAANTSAADVAS